MANYEGNNTGRMLGQVTTEHATAGMVLGCLLALILIRRGFRGVNLSGVGGINIK